MRRARVFDFVRKIDGSWRSSVRPFRPWSLLHEHQFIAVVEGDIDSTRFDLLIHMANEKKRDAKYALMRHIEEHGC